MSDANHRIGVCVCSRYACDKVSAIDTPMGSMCAEHASPLLFQVQLPHDYRLRYQETFFLPWEFVEPHDRQARINHGGQTLARLSERGGLTFDEVLAVLLGRPWRHVPFAEAKDRVIEMLVKWKEMRA